MPEDLLVVLTWPQRYPMGAYCVNITADVQLNAETTPFTVGGATRSSLKKVREWGELRALLNGNGDDFASPGMDSVRSGSRA